MTRPDAPPGRTGRPPRTSRAQILAAARRILERDGWEKLTIRRLAAEAGVATMTLYHHVRDREDLLIQLINELADQLPPPDLSGDPRDRIVAAATSMHDALAAWPWAAEVLTTDGFLSRLGESALRVVEAIVAGAVDHGCTPAQAVHVYRSIWYYTVGEILVRANSRHRRAGDGRPAEGATLFSGPDPSLGDLDPSHQPHLAAIGDRWGVLAAQDTYPEGLRAFVDGLLARAGSPEPGGPAP
ncbi:TetR/AcrR family transcriptional regulator [Pseudonocardia humida]|uniref:TetR/AcrR family transcriptional regulator n=1 Tax=Pseudonocardia humida TaxID=2800819 RepID=A0ABT1A9J2_9PSEU|nr:TetR/AcrR family transcriptional regulator [Pseudonocardia humida]MCO1659329.1 TetR/AcrR family transcriptional regulator [Pseudonocardia humida]